MRRWRGSSLAVLAAFGLAGCGDSGPGAPPAPPPGTERGQSVATAAGCLACHTIGTSGNDGPGQDLTRVGARLDREALVKVLVDAPEPMPSYSGLPQADLDALADYLAALR